MSRTRIGVRGGPRWVGLLVALGAVAAAPVAAQEAIDGHTFLPEDRWGKLPASARGKEYYLEGRWKECFGNKVFLYRAPESRDFLFVPEGSAVRVNLLRNRGSNPAEVLEPRQSRVRVFGRAVPGGRGCVLQVTRVELLPSDEERIRERLADAKGDPAALHTLAEEAAALAERYGDAELRRLAGDVAQEELQARREALDPDDHAGGLALASRMVEIGDRPGAIDLLSDLEARTKGGLREAVREQLGRLGAIRSGGGWVPYEVYKRSEGFVRREVDGRERWVRRSWLELQAQRKREIERQLEEMALPRVNAVQALEDAEAGRITRGQIMSEVRIAGGLPADVFHERAPDANGQPTVWTQWFLEDGTRVYFMDGQVISVVDEDVPLPGGEG